MSKNEDLESSFFGLQLMCNVGKRQSSSTPADTELQSSSGFLKHVKEITETVSVILFNGVFMGLEC